MDVPLATVPLPAVSRSAAPQAAAPPSALVPSAVPLSTVAVVGLGTMGTGIAEILAARGPRGHRHRHQRRRRRPRRRRPRGVHGPGRGARPAHRGGAAHGPRPVPHLLRPGSRRRAPGSSSRWCPSRTRPSSRSSGRWTRIVGPEAILATGTNALSVTRLAADSAHPERVLGLHFFNPAPAMRLVEVVSSRADRTDGRGRGHRPGAANWARSRSPVGDRPGFIADGLLFGYLNQAAAMYEAGYASREDIDAAMRLGCGLPMGPLALLDLIGVDTARTVLDAMYAASHDRLHAPAPILRPARRGRADRPQGGPRLLHVRGARRRGPRAGRAHPAHRRGDGAGPAGAVGRGRGLRHDGDRYRRGLREGRVRRGARRPEPREGGGRRRPCRHVSSAIRRQGQADARRRGERRSARIVPAGSLDALAEVDLAVEAVAEDLEIKRRLFATLDKVCRPGAVLATTTSSLAGDRLCPRDLPSRRTSSACTSSIRPRR